MLLSAQSIFSQNSLDKTGLSGSTYATAAYSMRLLSSGYSGKALQVRRSSDNTTRDIGFTAAGDLDTLSLKSFVGAGNAFVSAWYDQSGNALDLTEASASNQPTLVTGGTISRVNNQPFIAFYGTPGTSNYNALLLSADMTTVGHLSAVHRFAASGDGFVLSYTSDYRWHSNPPTNLINSTYASSSVQSGAAWVNGTSMLPDAMPWPTTLTIDEIEPSAASSATTWNNLGTDRISAHNLSDGGGYSELIIFPVTLLTADRQSLEANQTTYYSIGVPLPITWLSFTVRAQGAGVLLQWQTASEQNSTTFTVQHSTNATAWTELATLPAGGNSNSVRNYNYVDAHPANGDNYYRILETDLDGRINYSDIKDVIFTGVVPAFTVMVNPISNGLLQVKVNSAASLAFYSADGKLLWKMQSGAGVQNIDISAYPRGVYFLQDDKTTEKILVQ